MVDDISAREFAAMADDVYRSPTEGSRVPRWRRQNFHGDVDNGFFATAYHDTTSSSLVIAYRGSGADTGDWGLNGNLGNAIGLRLKDSQVNEAVHYFNACRDLYDASNVAVCGHSLGGFLAAVVALTQGVLGVTFDRPFVPYLPYGYLSVTNPMGSRLTNFHAGWDYVSLVRDGFGRWITVDVHFVQKLAAGRWRGALTHSMDHLYEEILLHPNADLPPARW